MINNLLSWNITMWRDSTESEVENLPTRSFKNASSEQTSMHKKWSCLLKIPSVNVNKSAVSCGFGQI